MLRLTAIQSGDAAIAKDYGGDNIIGVVQLFV